MARVRVGPSQYAVTLAAARARAEEAAKQRKHERGQNWVNFGQDVLGEGLKFGLDVGKDQLPWNVKKREEATEAHRSSMDTAGLDRRSKGHALAKDVEETNLQRLTRQHLAGVANPMLSPPAPEPSDGGYGKDTIKRPGGMYDPATRRRGAALPQPLGREHGEGATAPDRQLDAVASWQAKRMEEDRARDIRNKAIALGTQGTSPSRRSRVLPVTDLPAGADPNDPLSYRTGRTPVTGKGLGSAGGPSIDVVTTTGGPRGAATRKIPVQFVKDRTPNWDELTEPQQRVRAQEVYKEAWVPLYGDKAGAVAEAVQPFKERSIAMKAGLTLKNKLAAIKARGASQKELADLRLEGQKALYRLSAEIDQDKRAGRLEDAKTKMAFAKELEANMTTTTTQDMFGTKRTVEKSFTPPSGPTSNPLTPYINAFRKANGADPTPAEIEELRAMTPEQRKQRFGF